MGNQLIRVGDRLIINPRYITRVERRDDGLTVHLTQCDNALQLPIELTGEEAARFWDALGRMCAPTQEEAAAKSVTADPPSTDLCS